jgi:nitrous oxide reductase accessory protein NosL
VLVAVWVFPGQQPPVQPSSKDKCPVCGMFVSKFPNFLAIIVFEDGLPVFFDGVKDMFKFLFEVERYLPARRVSAIVSIQVVDYYTLDRIDARGAYYVLGSDVLGPMGRELIPLRREADAREFLKDHQGLRILTFKDVNPSVLKNLD